MIKNVQTLTCSISNQNYDATNVQYQILCPMFYLGLKKHRCLVDFYFIALDFKDRLC